MIKDGLNREKAIYRAHELEKSILIRDNFVKMIYIDQHYQKNHGSYLDDEIIIELVKQLKYFNSIPKRSKDNWNNFFTEPIWHKDKAYRLIWYTEEDDKTSLLVINCFRRNKYENKYEN